MPNSLVVDLASKHSAFQVRSSGGQVLTEGDSSGLSSFHFLDTLHVAYARYECVRGIFEDVPYGISSQAQTKPVTRLQGVVMREFRTETEQGDILFLNPSTWMTLFPGVQRAPKGMTKAAADKYRIEAARQHAWDEGYMAPDLVSQYALTLPEGAKLLKKHTNPLEKAMTDYVSAFLMGQWVNKNFDRILARTPIQGLQVAYI